jgi:hypothetical protein
VWVLLPVAEEEPSKVGVHAFVTADKLVGEGESRHQAMLLEPEDGGKGIREEDTLNSGESYKTFGKCGTLVRDPTERPVGLAFDARNCLDGIERELLLGGVLDVGVDEGIMSRSECSPS